MEEGWSFRNYEPLNQRWEDSRFPKTAAQGIWGRRNIVYGLKAPSDGFIKVTFIIAGKRKQNILEKNTHSIGTCHLDSTITSASGGRSFFLWHMAPKHALCPSLTWPLCGCVCVTMCTLLV